MARKINRKSSKGSAVEAVVFGVVQGVGFRPFVYRLAHDFHYKGWVKNIGFGVEIHLEINEQTDFMDFLRAFKKNKPPLSQIEEISIKPAPFLNLKGFEIKKSRQGESFVFISPDISICENCNIEMTTPSDRRFHYPFINCTDCGPRYTIVKTLPYDRKQTTMDKFTMCEDCLREYTNPLDRRYHAQPIACPACGPRVRLIEAKTQKEMRGGIEKASSLIKRGKILAIKGLGGFHLVCNAFNYQAVLRLRKIKERKTKPLALLARDLNIVAKYAHISTEEKKQLLSPRRPIILLRKKRDIKGIAPHLDELGFMISYTPLHYLLLEDIDLIVATSSNKKDSPIIKDEKQGIQELCDYILTHNRPIQMRADDSVMRVVDRKPLFIRRARGYVPYPQKVHKELESSYHILALGGELKDTISVYKNGYVITSQFLGDLDEYQNYKYFKEAILHLTKLFEIKPQAVVSDLHPDFHTTRYAQKLGLPHFQVQHHFAHTLAPLLEHKFPLDKKVLGVSFDGFGYGDDGSAWGAEFLLADYTSYQRFAHFQYVPLPGGDLASKQPWRMALSYLMCIFRSKIPKVKAFEKVSKNKIKGVMEMIDHGINSPLCSSCGRLFDAVSFLVGLSPLEVEFEAEAPMRLESEAADGIEESYKFRIKRQDNLRGKTKRQDKALTGRKTTLRWQDNHRARQSPNGRQDNASLARQKGNLLPLQISFSQTIESILKDLSQNTPISHISAKFHNTLAHVVVSVSEIARKKHNIDTVVLTGGVFLNKRVLYESSKLLERKGFEVLRPINYSPNDESISLGQIAYALNQLKA